MERCKFIENTGGSALTGAAGLYLGSRGVFDLRDCLFERNVGGADAGDGGAVNITGKQTTWRNVSFISNVGHNGAVLYANALALASVTLIDCYARSNHGSANGAGLKIENADLHVFDSTFAETTGDSYEAFLILDNSIISFHNSTIRDSLCSAGTFAVREKSSLSFTDCRLLNNRALLQAGVLDIADASVSFLRTTVADNSAGSQGGCFNIGTNVAFSIGDSDIVNSRSGLDGGVARFYGDGTMATILNSRISGSSAVQKGSVFYLEGSVLRIAGSTITDSAEGSFAVYDSTGIDFSIQVCRAVCS